MIVTIDGPAGAGKSTAAKGLAKKLGFHFLDTGAMYRAVALAALDRELSWDDPEALAALAHQLCIEFVEERAFLDGVDITDAIRSSEVTDVVQYAADNVAVRERMVQLQRQVARGQNIVTEGRDQGTVVFPEAECKIYLTASPEQRAERRLVELQRRGENVSLPEVLGQLNQRDHRDKTRACGRLEAAADAISVSTDRLTPDEVVSHLETLVHHRGVPPQ